MANTSIPEATIPTKYFIGYPPKKHNIITIKKIIPAVEKLAGRMSMITKNTGNHKGKILSLKVTTLFLTLVKYLAIYIISTTDAKLEV